MRTVKRVEKVRRQQDRVLLSGKWGQLLIKPEDIEKRRSEGVTEIGYYTRTGRSVNSREVAYLFPGNWYRQLRITGLHIAFGELKDRVDGGMLASVVDAVIVPTKRPVRRRIPR